MRCIACNGDGALHLHTSVSYADMQVWKGYECSNCELNFVVHFRADDKTLKEMVGKGKKISAIRLYRMATGKGLIEAKKYVDGLHAEWLDQKIHAGEVEIK